MHQADDLLWRAEAVSQVHAMREEAVAGRETRQVALDDIAGHVLAESVEADRDLPERATATMDGFAFDATGDPPFDLVERAVYPEDDPPAVEPGQAVRIATGAPLPEGTNAVLQVEKASVDGGHLRGEPIDPGTYTYQAGTNVSRGEVLFRAGERLSAKDALLLADLGRERVTAVEPFSVACVATGTEIHEGTSRDLDSEMLANLVRSWDHEVTYEGTVPDDYDRVAGTLTDLAARYDVVITTGGTSVGEKDHVVSVLEDRGDLRFHRVRIRPGKPVAAATLDDAVCLAVPGKPLGAYVITALVLAPFFTGPRRLSTVPATLDRDVELDTEGFEYAVPVTLEDGDAMPIGHVDSALAVYERTFDPSRLSSCTRATRADGFVLTDSSLARGERVTVVPTDVLE
jgi:molybdopterin molybdotransferase